MSEMTNIVVKDVISRATAVSSDDGDVVYNNILAELTKKRTISLDFDGITLMTTAFLNSAIGQLYSRYTSDELNETLKLKNVAEEDRVMFKKVIDRAKQYQANKKGFEDSANNAIYGG